MKQNDSTHVWRNGEYLGRIAITQEDWKEATSWQQAAMNAARRAFKGSGLYVDDSLPPAG